MLIHRNATLAFIVLAAAGLVLASFSVLSIYWLAPLLAVYAGLEVRGATCIGAGYHFKSRCRAQTGNRVIALTFDDGPSPLTGELLERLRKHGCKATFFLIGQNAAAHPALVRQLLAEGHAIGNHSYAHGFWFDFYPWKKMKSELARTRDLLFEQTGLRTRFFRPPYGVTCPGLGKAIAAMNFISVGWSVRSLDSCIRNQNRLLRRVTRRIHPGAILLFHDGPTVTPPVLDRLLAWLVQNHYTVVPLDELLKIQPYE
jgi:peptidoglycan/xylan/chitin deacetylase (PgdA/CDA1 family)